MKSGLTETKYQSTFLPLIQRAETEIKKLINEFALFKKSKYELKQRIKAIIELVDKKLPPKLYDRTKYIKGLEIVSEKMIKEYYDKVIRGYLLAVGIFIGLGLPEPKNPYELNKIITEPKNLFSGVDLQTKKEYISLWAEAKGSPYIENYPQALKDKMTELAETTTRSGEGGKQPISLWQKAEIDLRYQKQMERIEELKRDGIELAYISSHPDCSKRCEKLQGHLVSLTEHAENPQRVVKKSDYSDLRISTYRIRKIGNQWVYSLPDIMATETKGGWNNMIICGFSCRHRLIAYTGQLPPKEYSSEDIKKEREINAKMREMERRIKLYKQQSMIYNKTDKKLSKQYEVKANKLLAEYKKFANDNGFATELYRTKI